MTTDEQIEANKENAQLSTGPKTEEGKQISKMNALKHGLLSQEVLITGESEDELTEFEKRMRGHLKPAGELELLLVDKLISYAWRLRRVLSVEKAIMVLEKTTSIFHVMPSEKDDKRDEMRQMKNIFDDESIEKLTRYEVTIVKHFYKALHELMRLQALRRGDRPPLPVALDIDND